MTEAMRDHWAGSLAPVATANGGPLRWTPGPDELRLPFSDGKPLSENTRQLVAIVDCFDGLQRHLRGRRDVFVGADQFIHRDPDYHPKKNPCKPPVAPDVYVAFGVANRHRRSYVPWEEGKAPDFVLEVASPSSHRRDAEEKPGIYAEMGVKEFFLYDPEGRLDPPLRGSELCDKTYKRLPEEELRNGVVGIRSKVLGLGLCIASPGPEPLDGALRLYDPATGEFLTMRLELADGKREADARAAKAEAETEEARAEAAEARTEAADALAQAADAQTKMAELQALVNRLRGD